MNHLFTFQALLAAVCGSGVGFSLALVPARILKRWFILPHCNEPEPQPEAVT